MYVESCALEPHPQPTISWSIVPAFQLSSIQWHCKWHWLYFPLPIMCIFLDFQCYLMANKLKNKPIIPLKLLPRPALQGCDVSKVQSDQWILNGIHCASECLSHPRLLQTSQVNLDNYYFKNTHNPPIVIFGLGRWNCNSDSCFMKEKRFWIWG